MRWRFSVTPAKASRCSQATLIQAPNAERRNSGAAVCQHLRALAVVMQELHFVGQVGLRGPIAAGSASSFSVRTSTLGLDSGYRCGLKGSEVCTDVGKSLVDLDGPHLLLASIG